MDTKKLEIASVNQADLIFAILEENAKWLESKKIFQWPLNWLQSKKEELFNSIENGRYYYIEVNNKMACIVEISVKSELDWNNKQCNAIYINKLAVNRKYSGLGLGLEMLHLIKKYAIKINKSYIRLDVVASNIALREYYESNDFYFVNNQSNGEINVAKYEHKV